jgi:hypothetical protein
MNQNRRRRYVKICDWDEFPAGTACRLVMESCSRVATRWYCFYFFCLYWCLVGAVKASKQEWSAAVHQDGTKSLDFCSTSVNSWLVCSDEDCVFYNALDNGACCSKSALNRFICLYIENVFRSNIVTQATPHCTGNHVGPLWMHSRGGDFVRLCSHASSRIRPWHLN